MKNPAYEIHCRYNLSARADVNGIKEHTTMEMLQIDPTFYHTAVIPYHDYLVLGIWHGIRESGDFSSAVYRFDTNDRTIEGSLSLIMLREKNFDDMGDAVRYGLNYAESCQTQEMMRKKV